jgi:hypothetical protein
MCMRQIVLGVAVTLLPLLLNASCSHKLPGADLSPQERELSAWQQQSEVRAQDRLASLGRRLREDESRLVNGRGLGQSSIDSDREAIRREQEWLKTCGDMVRSELELAKHNRLDPSHPEAGISDIRKLICGGP